MALAVDAVIWNQCDRLKPLLLSKKVVITVKNYLVLESMKFGV